MVWERQLSVEPGRLWSAIATREGLSHWFMSTKFEITEGGSFSFEGGWDGTISEIEPYRHIQFNVGDDNGGWLRFVIDADDDGCLFSLIDRMGAGISPDKMKGPDTPRRHIHQPGGAGTHWTGVTGGYHCFVDSLESHITGNRIDQDYDEMCRLYETVLDDYHGRREL